MKKNIMFIIAGAAALAAAAVGIFIYANINSPGIENTQAPAVQLSDEPDYTQETDETDAVPEVTPVKENNGIYYYDIEEISLDEDFVETMLQYPVEDMIGSKGFAEDTSDLQSLVNAFEQVWFSQYDEQIIAQQRPYAFEYDKEKGLWIVMGSNVCTGDVCLGILKVMISDETGEVLSAWGMK